MMNVKRLYQILGETTQQYRKGPAVTEREADHLRVTEIYAMPHEDEAPDIDKVDMHFVTIGVDADKAQQHREELIRLLRDYPQPERLAGGPSYIELGAEVGDQGAALQLMALGKTLGLWDVITPAAMGITGPEADQMAGGGFVMISGFREAA